jgi:hypothetical protein
MNTAGFTAGRASLNVTVNAAQAVIQQIIAAGIDQGKPVALFANETGGGGGTGNLMCPLTSTQDNGSAPWVDSSQDLTTLGVDPANDLLYLQIWIEAMGNYEMAGTIIRELGFGESITTVLS